MYIHLHWHSHYSLLEAIGKVPKIIDKAKELGFPAIGITDYHGMYGIMEFYTKATKYGIKPICGIELTISHILGKKPDQEQFIVLIAKNYTGYKNLMKLTTIANTKGMDIVPTLDGQTLEQYHEGLICVLGGPRSLLARWIDSIKAAEPIETISKEIAQYQRLFGSDLYLEVIAQDYTLEPSLKALNNQIILLWQHFQLPIIVSSNFHYVAPSDRLAFETALAIKDQRLMTDPNRRKLLGEYHIMSEEQVHAILTKNWYSEEQIGIRFDTNQSVSDTIALELPKPIAKFPLYKTSQEFAELYEKTKDGLVLSST
jgi:DNA polymerase-3 subunit alpha